MDMGMKQMMEQEMPGAGKMKQCMKIICRETGCDEQTGADMCSRILAEGEQG